MSTELAANWLATGFGTGYTPLPGTTGALLGLVLALTIAAMAAAGGYAAAGDPGGSDMQQRRLALRR